MKANSLEELVTNSNIAEELRNYTDWHTRLVKFAQLVADWQKEQDQPITGNSLEQEWLRYVDKKKKEYGGELPSLGEYGWLQIVRHFAEWQKSKMLKDAVEGEICGRVYDHINVRFADGVCKYLEPKNISHIPADVSKYNIGDKVRIVVLKEEE